MVGVYALEAKSRPLRGNVQINWGENLLTSPVGFGQYAAFNMIHSTTSAYDIRIDFDGVDPQGKPMQYFHNGALLYSNGNVVHKSITSLADGSAAWKVIRGIDPDFGK